MLKEKYLVYFLLTCFLILSQNQDISIGKPNSPPHPNQQTAKSKSSSINLEKFTATHRAAVTLQTATEEGIAYKEYTQLIREYATEIALSKEQAQTKKELELLHLYNRIIVSYRDAAESWQYKIKDSIEGDPPAPAPCREYFRVYRKVLEHDLQNEWYKAGVYMKMVANLRQGREASANLASAINAISEKQKALEEESNTRDEISKQCKTETNGIRP